MICVMKQQIGDAYVANSSHKEFVKVGEDAVWLFWLPVY